MTLQETAELLEASGELTKDGKVLVSGSLGVFVVQVRITGPHLPHPVWVKSGVGPGILCLHRNPPGDSDKGYPWLKVKQDSSVGYFKPQLLVLGSTGSAVTRFSVLLII